MEKVRRCGGGELNPLPRYKCHFRSMKFTKGRPKSEHVMGDDSVERSFMPLLRKRLGRGYSFFFVLRDSYWEWISANR